MKPKRTLPSTAWKPGQSGNPSGRPKLSQEEESAISLSREFSPDAVRALHEIAIDRRLDPRARVVAANSLLDRAFGKPKETTETTVKHDRRDEASVLAELVALGLVAGGQLDEGTADDKGGSSLH